MDENVTAVIPAYNEAECIAETVNALKKLSNITEIIVVDDGSIDETYAIIQDFDGVKAIHNAENRGKGYAVKSALPHISNDYVLLVDADLKESASEISKLVSQLKSNENAMLVATYPNPLKKGGFGMVKKLSQKGLLLLASKTSESVLSGQRLMHADFLKNLDLPDTFGLEFKITLEALRRDLDIIEVPLNIRHRETGRDLKGFVHRGRQFANILRVVIREWIQ